ncbi:PGR5-like protein 1A, chloroplastic [Aristolochia californica]|uniref:PGR5-like protein 1A, chloroplastic n=1 Tax=Aristolochia californica TaxID=171875 RepID=UPI0035DD7EC4
MAGTCTFSSHVTGSSVERSQSGVRALSKLTRTGAPLCWKVPARTGAVFACMSRKTALAEAPSCIFVGPVETASKDVLEALYHQARDSYYSGRPLIVDDMFDKIELKLRWYGSKSVVKYPRCSLRRHATYADAEEDPSQALALAGIWVLVLAFTSFSFLVPAFYFIGVAHQDAVGSRFSGARAVVDLLTTMNGFLFMGLGSVIGYPIMRASVQALQGLCNRELVALKGSCPNCGEEVFAFVQAVQSNQSPHRADCHVCESSLEFWTKVEQSSSRRGRTWVYGRIYLVSGSGTRYQRWR